MQANSSEFKRTSQANSTLADRLRWVLDQHGLQQQELAVVMGVKVDRVKSLVLGRARKLRAEEIERLQAAYGLAREWLVSGNGSALARHANAQPTAAVPPPGAQAHEAGRGRPYLPPTSATDALLLQQVVDATSAALTARGIRLSPQRRLRLYWAVFELSIAGGEVNHAAIAPLLALAESAG